MEQSTAIEGKLSFQWANLREVWMKLHLYLTPEVKEHLRQALLAIGPISVPNPPTWGDSGDVTFPDLSEIRWDWDNGDFEIESVRFEYPCQSTYSDDPLFWTYETKYLEESSN